MVNETQLTLEDVEKAIQTIERFMKVVQRYQSTMRRLSYTLGQSNISVNRPEDFMRMLLQSNLIKPASQTKIETPNEDEIELNDEEAKKIIEKYKEKEKESS